MSTSTTTARTNYIFVDYENVPNEIDIDRIAGKPVKMTLVLGEAHKKLPVPLVRKLLKVASQIELIETGRTGKNALDLVLAEHIGEAKQADPAGFFHILSGDKDFDALIGHLNDSGTLAARRASLSEIPVLMNLPERVKHLTAQFKAKPGNRATKRDKFEAQMQATFGRALLPDDVEATVNALVAAKVLTLSATGDITYKS